MLCSRIKEATEADITFSKAFTKTSCRCSSQTNMERGIGESYEESELDVENSSIFRQHGEINKQSSFQCGDYRQNQGATRTK